MQFERAVLEFDAWLRQPDRNDDAALPVAHETRRVLRLGPAFYSWVFPSPIPDACGPRHSSEHIQRADA